MEEESTESELISLDHQMVQKKTEMEEEGETVQPKKCPAFSVTSNWGLRRQLEDEKEEESIQTKPLHAQINPLVQRTAGPDEKEEIIQSQSVSRGIVPIAQRQKFDEDGEVQIGTETGPGAQIQAQVTEKEEKQFQPKETSGSKHRDTSYYADRLKFLKGSGKSLPDQVRTSFENRFGHDFGSVRTHTGSAASDLARSIKAKAFTRGNDIVFGAGQYSTESRQGKRLLAHELTHVVQQSPSNHQKVQLKKLRSRSGYVNRKILTSTQVNKLQKMLNNTLANLKSLERAILLASEEREKLTLLLIKMVRRIGVLGEKRRYSTKKYNLLRKYRSKFIEGVEKKYKYSNLLKTLKERKKTLRKSGKIVSDLKITPQLVRIQEGDAAHISFNLKTTIKGGYVIFIEKNAEGQARIMELKSNKSGYRYIIWTGFWGPSNPATTGTYWLNLVVTDNRGSTDSLWAIIRVENKAEGLSVGLLPNIKQMKFNGKQLIVEDTRGNIMKLHAISGIKDNHKLYKQCKRKHIGLYHGSKPDFTQSKFQWAVDCGPLPEGEYTIHVSSVEPPKTTRMGRKVHPRIGREKEASVRVWGPWRFRLSPNVRKKNDIIRSGFFVHLDKKGDGTAGCIGIQPEDEGKLNMLFSLIRRMKRGNIRVKVKY